MLKKVFYSILIWVIYTNLLTAQNIHIQIDSLIAAKTIKPFNGIVLVSKNSETDYVKIAGYSNLEKKVPLLLTDQFIVGSISKQFTAVLILQQYDKGHLKLHDPIHTYLPNLPQSWADTVTIHQLLTHTHGITALNIPLAFPAGTQFMYSQLGYELLSQIAEKTSGKTFANLSQELFSSCKMTNSFHPYIHEYKHLAQGYSELQKGTLSLEPENESTSNYIAAGSFISTPQDLVVWNTLLHTGKLLKDSTYQLMITQHKNAVRDHPIFGTTYYGYGITVDYTNDLIQLGQTGFAPGFVSMNFYYPKTKMSIVVLENTAWDTDDLKKTFYYHQHIQKIIRRDLLSTKKLKL